MNKEETISQLKQCLYSGQYGQTKASVATIKHLINNISGEHTYCKTETMKSKLHKPITRGKK